ncbi:MAG: hypothetical protein FJ109_19130 [Deltaproteobacteria bacterium]|nr:hypothetical protein [Deltaproteobacteria bacterium]
MRRKVSTLLDDRLFLRAKLEAVRRRKQLSEIFEEALARHLDDAGVPLGTGSAVEQSRGAIKATPAQLKAVMEEEDDFLVA